MAEHEFVPDRIMPCPYLPKRQHGDDCSLCQGSGEVPVKEVPPRFRLLPPSDMDRIGTPDD
jgi:hypothetical protein